MENRCICDKHKHGKCICLKCKTKYYCSSKCRRKDTKSHTNKCMKNEYDDDDIDFFIVNDSMSPLDHTYILVRYTLNEYYTHWKKFMLWWILIKYIVDIFDKMLS